MNIVCSNCWENIEYDGVTSSINVPCPICDHNLGLEVPPIPLVVASTRGSNEIYSFTNTLLRLCRLTLRSGVSLEISHFVLHSEATVLDVRKHLAAEKGKYADFAGNQSCSSSNEGSDGSAAPASTEDSSSIYGSQPFCGGAVSALIAVKERLGQQGEAFPIQNIRNVERVDLTLWIAGYTKYEFSKDRGYFHLAKVCRYFVPHDERSVMVVTTDGRRPTIVWANVEQYEVLT